ncbi:MAG: sulfurtransferase complex subunit TusC [Spongiibacteraceae bacterium]
MKKTFLLICRHAPYGNSRAREALDVALTAATFDQPVTMLFLGDGVLQLLRDQQPAAIAQKALDKQLAALPLYDVETIYVEAAALLARGLDSADFALPVQVLTSEQIARQIDTHDVVLGF